jgi:2-octaprenyl-6-methoxyphenol hydroxylase
VGPAPETARHVDVLVAGAGIVGLTLAIALRQSLGAAGSGAAGSSASFSVAVADPALAGTTGDGRATAIVAAARRLLTTIGVWDSVPAQPILDMVVTDSALDDTVRPTFLTFAGDVEPGEPFGHMVENAPLTAALVAKARDERVALHPFAVRLPSPLWGGVGGGVSEIKESALPISLSLDRRSYSSIDVELGDGQPLSATLLVAADGARSAIRECAGIAVHGWAYGQSAIVTTVAHERDHGGRAEEHFLSAGPFAILPLTGRRSSIVWTEEAREAERMVALPDHDFHAELERRFGLHLGEIEIIGNRSAHPVGLWVARSFIAERIALVGDAAHVIHPIAGQGLNMGLKDVAALAEVIVDAVRLGLDPGSVAALERYQRWRRFDTMAMGVATDGLNRLFSNKSDVLRLARDVGLGVVDRWPALKQLFIREAAGLAGEVPKLLRGEAL